MTDATNSTNPVWFPDPALAKSLGGAVLPHLLANRPNRSIRIWSAGCAGGEETYSICMMLMDAGEKLEGWEIDILATDPSPESVQRAKDGLYTQYDIQRGLPITHLLKYFEQAERKWRVRASLQSVVTFQTFDPIADTPYFGPFDVIVCRNLPAQDDAAAKQTVL